MARDYKHRGRSRGRARPRPCRAWAAGGLAVGLALGLATHLWPGSPGGGRPGPRPAPVDAPRDAPAASARPAEAHPEGGTSAKRPSPLHFDFYALLPEQEVVVTEPEAEEARTPSARPAAPAGAQGPAAGGGPPEVPHVLQAGSFRQRAEAEALKGELALLGVVAHIQEVSVGGETWYRVRIGPLPSASAGRALQARLREAGVTTLLLRLRSG